MAGINIQVPGDPLGRDVVSASAVVRRGRWQEWSGVGGLSKLVVGERGVFGNVNLDDGVWVIWIELIRSAGQPIVVC